MLHDGPGAAASAEPSRRWAEISTTLAEVGQDLQKALEQSGTSWSGQAAGRAYDRLSTSAAWATETGAEAAEMRTAVESQAEHVARARADMPAPEDVPATQPDPTVAPAVQVAAAQTDLETAESAASSAEERAFEVMAAYELNTTTTTDALATFEAPPALVQEEGVHQGQSGVGSQHTSASGAGGWPTADVDRRPPWQSGQPGGSWPGTGGASAPWTEPAPAARPTAPAPVGQSGGMPMSPLFMSTNDRSSQRTSRGGPGSGNGAPGSSGSLAAGSGSASVNSGSAAARPGMTSLGVPTSDLHVAAAGQAAANVHSAGAPIAPAAGGAVAAQDKMAMRRFGMEAIGSNQWFGDVDEPVVGQSPRRRRDFKENEQVTESVSILGEEHKLPPTVIGDGPTR